MKTKLLYGVITLFSLFLFPNIVKAAQVSISCSSNSVYVGDTITCRISGSATQVSSVKGNISYSSNLAFVSAAKISCPNGDVGASNFDCIGEMVPGSITVASYTFKANSAGAATVSITGSEIVDETFNVVSGGSASSSITISNRPVVVPPVVKNTSLASVTIDKIPFTFNKGTYTYNFDVNYDIDAVKVNYQKGDKDQNVSLSGSETLKTGLNVIKLTVKNGSDVSTYTFNINKRDEYITYSFTENSKLKELLNIDSNSKILVDVKDINDKLIDYATLNLIKDKKKTVTYKVYDKEVLLYSITFDGSKIDNLSSYFDLNILLNSNNLKLTDKYYNFDLTQKNNINGTLKLEFANDKLEKEAYLYTLRDGAYTYIDKVSITDKIELDLKECANYVLSQNKIEGAKKEVLKKDNKLDLILFIIIGVLVVTNIICIIFLILKKKKTIVYDHHLDSRPTYINGKKEIFTANMQANKKGQPVVKKEPDKTDSDVEIIDFDDSGDTK